MLLMILRMQIISSVSTIYQKAAIFLQGISKPNNLLRLRMLITTSWKLSLQQKVLSCLQEIFLMI